MSEKKEYIDRGALSGFVRNVRKNLPKDSKDFFTRDEMLLNFQQYIDAQTAAEVEPVVRATWTFTEEFAGSKWYKCSSCDGEVRFTFAFKHCPYCGAHMERSGSGE